MSCFYTERAAALFLVVTAIISTLACDAAQVAVQMALRLFVAGQAQQRNTAGDKLPRAAHRRLMESDVAAKLASGETLQVESAVMRQRAFKHLKPGVLAKARALWVIGADSGSTREAAAMRGAAPAAAPKSGPIFLALPALGDSDHE